MAFSFPSTNKKGVFLNTVSQTYGRIAPPHFNVVGQRRIVGPGAGRALFVGANTGTMKTQGLRR